jgi:hypothetical protein
VSWAKSWSVEVASNSAARYLVMAIKVWCKYSVAEFLYTTAMRQLSQKVLSASRLQSAYNYVVALQHELC